ncbi:Txe/YoeB family addiction module toxin [Rhizobium sp. SG2393]|uniref:Txe/YoeB family addiction module toxin n=1 Tax=Rhizobium sp. SG2393 TaxID=3276279 RepID=UPI003672E692
MKLLFTAHAWEEYLYWQKTDPKMLEKLNELIRDTKRNPFTGLGKPDPLKGDLTGFWSRRILAEHRLVYRITGKDDARQVQIVQCRFHYER